MRHFIFGFASWEISSNLEILIYFFFELETKWLFTRKAAPALGQGKEGRHTWKFWFICWTSCSCLPAVTETQAVMQHWFLHSANSRCGCSRCNLDFISAGLGTNSSSGTDHVSRLGSQMPQAVNHCKSLLIPEPALQKACVYCSQSSYLQCNRWLKNTLLALMNEMQ